MNLFILNASNIINHAYREFPLTLASSQPINRKKHLFYWEPIDSPYHWGIGIGWELRRSSSSVRREPKWTNGNRCRYIKIIVVLKYNIKDRPSWSILDYKSSVHPHSAGS